MKREDHNLISDLIYPENIDTDERHVQEKGKTGKKVVTIFLNLILCIYFLSLTRSNVYLTLVNGLFGSWLIGGLALFYTMFNYIRCAKGSIVIADSRGGRWVIGVNLFVAGFYVAIGFDPLVYNKGIYILLFLAGVVTVYLFFHLAYREYLRAADEDTGEDDERLAKRNQRILGGILLIFLLLPALSLGTNGFRGRDKNLQELDQAVGNSFLLQAKEAYLYWDYTPKSHYKGYLCWLNGGDGVEYVYVEKEMVNGTRIPASHVAGGKQYDYNGGGWRESAEPQIRDYAVAYAPNEKYVIKCEKRKEGDLTIYVVTGRESGFSRTLDNYIGSKTITEHYEQTFEVDAAGFVVGYDEVEVSHYEGESVKSTRKTGFQITDYEVESVAEKLAAQVEDPRMPEEGRLR